PAFHKCAFGKNASVDFRKLSFVQPRFGGTVDHVAIIEHEARLIGMAEVFEGSNLQRSARLTVIKVIDHVSALVEVNKTQIKFVAGIGRARASAKTAANGRNRFVITAEQHYLCCRIGRATRWVQARNSLVSNVLNYGESVTMVTSPEPALKPHRRGIEPAIILALSFVAIIALHGKMQPTVLGAETGYYQVIAHTSPRHERTLLRGFWTTSSHGHYTPLAFT